MKSYVFKKSMVNGERRFVKKGSEPIIENTSGFRELIIPKAATCIQIVTTKTKTADSIKSLYLLCEGDFPKGIPVNDKYCHVLWW